MPLNQAEHEYLLNERDGSHGQSERRAVAAFILDACDGDPAGPDAEATARSLADFADLIAAELSALSADPPPA